MNKNNNIAKRLLGAEEAAESVEVRVKLTGTVVATLREMAEEAEADLPAVVRRAAELLAARYTRARARAAKGVGAEAPTEGDD